ncbi:MAG: M20/M25/M40 family metallo-hydrolase [Thermoplasmata archaeon]
MSGEGAESLRSRAEAVMGGPEPLDLLSALVSLAPTNLEDPPHGRYEKPHYTAAIDRILREARAAGFSTRIYDPTADPRFEGHLPGGPRPNGIIDLDRGAGRTALILAHYDVVPVPEEQRPRWKTPPFTLTARPDGRLYGRGANDDLGSGVVTSLTAMRRLAGDPDLSVNVRLLVCCDEETGGEGGIEAIRAHDARLPPDDPDRILRADVALIPDASPHTIAGSSGVAFLDATAEQAMPLGDALRYGERLVSLHDLARRWRSSLRSDDWPDHGAPEPVITGRATVTRMELEADSASPPGPSATARLVLAHTETDAANQIARTVTLAFEGPGLSLEELRRRLAVGVPPPFRVEAAGATGARIPPGAVAIAVVGEGGHGGSPHRARNPVPVAIAALRRAIAEGWLSVGQPTRPAFVVDLRIPPEQELDPSLREVFDALAPWLASELPAARVVAPPGRCRPGYFLPETHPMVRRLARTMEEVFHEPGIFGEYGGTDASSLRGLRTPSGEPLPALVFGSMDRDSRIHDAEESIDPMRFAGVVEVLRRFLRGL